jgi:hypothetical protein
MTDKLGPAAVTSRHALTQEQLFQAALARFQDHAELLRVQTGLDLQIIGGAMTLQLGLAAWLVEHPPEGAVGKTSLLVLSFTFTFVAIALLYTSFRRRKEVVNSLDRAKRYLRFLEKGAYLPDDELDAPMVFMPWWPLYRIACIVGFLAVASIIVFGSP